VAAAVLELAERAPSRPIVMLPTNYWIAKESVFSDAIELALWSLPRCPNGIATLGMADTHADGEEDYLVLGQSNGYTGADIHAYVRKPGSKAAK
jgi:mannose-1-phosphate guanylyltransferase